MDTTTTATLSTDDVIKTLNDLIETGKDGEYGFTTCAEHAKAPELRTLFAACAADCRTGVQELQQQVVQLGGKPDDSGSAAGAMHRGWVAVKTAMTSHDDLAVLNECERGEDAAKAAYKKALDKALPPAIRTLVLRQYDGVQRNHDRVRDLRNSYRARAEA